MMEENPNELQRSMAGNEKGYRVITIFDFTIIKKGQREQLLELDLNSVLLPSGLSLQVFFIQNCLHDCDSLSSPFKAMFKNPDFLHTECYFH